MEIKIRDIYFVMSNRGGVEPSIMSELLSLRPSPSAKACYWFGKMMRLFTQETIDANASRTRLIEEIGVENEDGDMHIPLSETEKMKEFMEKFNAVLDETVDLPIRLVKLSELGDCPVTIDLMNSISFVIDDEENVPLGPSAPRKKSQNPNEPD